MFKKATAQNNWHDYVEERLSAYIDGELSDAERNQVRKHLNECPQCRASLDSLGWTIKLVKQLPAPPLPRQFTLPVPETAPARSPASGGWLRWGLTAASLVAMLAFGVLLAADLLSPRAGAVPTSVALAPAAAPRTQVESNRAAQPTSAPASSDRAFGAEPTAVPPMAAAAPVQATAAPAEPTEASAAAQAVPATQAPAATLPPRATSKAAPTTAPCETGCGAGAPTGLGGGGGDATTESGTPGPRLSVQSLAGPVPNVVASGRVNATELNVRAAPDLSADLLGILYQNAPVSVVGRDATDDWLEILFSQPKEPEKTGWVYRKYVTVLGSVELPVVTPEPSPTPTATTSAP